MARRRAVNPYGPLPPLIFQTEKILPPPGSMGGPGGEFGRTITVLATNKLRIPIIYGKRRVGASIVWERPLSDGSWLAVYLIGWGPINSITNIKVSNEAIATFGINAAIYLGNSTTNATVNLNVQVQDALWTSRLPGIAYVVLRFPNPQSVADGKESDPHSFQCDVEGLQIPDHRLDSTLTNLYYTENVALCRADYWTNKRYGRRRPTTMVDWSTVDGAANECDHDIGGGKKRFKIGIALGPDPGKWSENDRIIRLHAQMWDSFSQGKWQMFVDVDQTPSSIALTDVGLGANIIEAYLRDKEPEEVYNYVEFTYTDQANEFKQGSAVSSDPGIGTGTVTCIYQANYQTDGCPDYDQAKRLSVWAYNRCRLDKEYVIDVLYDGGVKCVPGLVVPVTSSDLDVTGQLMIIKSVEDIDDLSFRLTCELFSHTTYSDTIQTTSASAPPAGASPFGPLPAPTGFSLLSLVDEFQPGVFVPKIQASFTPYSGLNAGGTLLTVQVGGGTVHTYGPFGGSPVSVVITDGWGQTVTVKAYTVDKNTLQAGSLFATATTTVYDPSTVEPVGFITYDNAGGLYWSKPPLTRNAVSTSAWTHSGLSFFDSTKIDDGNTSVTAATFPTTGGEFIQFTAGGALNEVTLTFQSLEFLGVFGNFSIQYFNGTTWITPIFSLKSRGTTGKVCTFFLSTTIGTNGTQWRITHSSGNSVSQNLAEIDPIVYVGTYPYVKGYRLTGYDLHGNLWQKTIDFTPTSTNPIKLEEWTAQFITYHSQSNELYFASTHSLLQVEVITSNNTISALGDSYEGFSFALPANSDSPTTLGTGSSLISSPSTSDNNLNIATTAFVKAQSYAPIASPIFTGNPTAPTPSAGDNDTSISTTAFVQSAIDSKVIKASAAWNPGTIGVGGVSSHTFTVTGASAGDPCSYGVTGNDLGNHVVSILVDVTANAVTITIFNLGTVVETFSSQTWTILVYKY